MGWNSWNKFACNINEQIIREAADAMVANGMKAAGYQSSTSTIAGKASATVRVSSSPTPRDFPSGIRALADYVHGKGLKLGIYSDAGAKTCGGHAGSRGHEFQDAQTYAQWNVDYLKYDWCNCGDMKPDGAYATMRDRAAVGGAAHRVQHLRVGQQQAVGMGRRDRRSVAHDR